MIKLGLAMGSHDVGKFLQELLRREEMLPAIGNIKTWHREINLVTSNLQLPVERTGAMDRGTGSNAIKDRASIRTEGERIGTVGGDTKGVPRVNDGSRGRVKGGQQAQGAKGISGRKGTVGTRSRRDGMWLGATSRISLSNRQQRKG